MPHILFAHEKLLWLLLLVPLLLLFVLGSPDLGLIFSTYVGYWLMGIALLAVGMAASLFTSSVTVAFIWGVLVCALLTIPDQLANVLPRSVFARAVLQDLSFGKQFEGFGNGSFKLFGGLFKKKKKREIIKCAG